MKKAILLLCALLCVATTAFAEKKTAIGIGYTTSTINFELLNKKSSYTTKTVAFTLDTIVDVGTSPIGFFGNMQLAMPEEMNYKSDSGSQTIALKTSYDFDMQMGLGYTFLKGSPFNIFAGAGLAMNTGSYTYKAGGDLLKAFIGASGVVKADYYISNNFGFFAGLNYTNYFMPLLLSERTSGYSVDIKEYYTSANSFNVRAGIALKY